MEAELPIFIETGELEHLLKEKSDKLKVFNCQVFVGEKDPDPIIQHY